MSPYAAGCAVCGADLDPSRWDSGPSRLSQAGSWLSALGFGPRRRVNPFLLLFLLLFGGTIIGAILSLV